MKSSRVLLLLVLASLVSSSAWAYLNQGAVRGVYSGGKLNYITTFFFNKDVDMGFYQTDVDPSNWNGPWTNEWASPDSTIKLPKDWNLMITAWGNEYGQSLLLFGAQLINVAIAMDGNGDPWVLVTRYDLTQQKFLDCRGIVKLGYHNSGDGYGAAAVVIGGQITIFTSAFTLVSSDGVNFQQLPAVASGLSGYEPMDAVTIYPEEGPAKVLIAFSKRTKYQAGYIVWDGTTLPMPSSTFRTIGQSNNRYLAGAAMIGTVKGTTAPYFSFPSGKKVPSAQLFLVSFDPIFQTYLIERYEYDVNADTLQAQGSNVMQNPLLMFRVFPWFETTSEDSSDPGAFYVQQQQLVLNTKLCSGQIDCSGYRWTNFPIPSDYMVPQNQDPATGGYGWQGIPTNTGMNSADPEELATWRSYWSLSGVILGPPPFKTNGIDDDYALHEMANVEYGMNASNSIKHTVSWKKSTMLSSGTELKVGLGKKSSGMMNFDVTYKQGSEGKTSDQTTTSGGIAKTLGTSCESDPDWGTYGYAIFVTPLLVTQDLAIYAYDYNFQNRTGTPLNQDFTTVVQMGTPTPGGAPTVNIQSEYFSLQEPGGQDDEIPGLLTFAAPFPVSQDLDAWSQTIWERADAPWKVIYGTGTHGGSQVAPFGLGTTDVTFSNETTKVNSQGTSNGVDVKMGFGLMSKLFLGGIKSSLTAGYDSEYSDTTTDESEVSQDLKLSLHLPIPSSSCNDPDFVKNLSIQPYLLQATDYSAPWVPTGYGLNLPWCITWNVQGKMCDGRTIGQSPPPGEIQGQIGGSDGFMDSEPAEAVGSKWSTYSIRGGHLQWQHPDGSIEPIPMTADGFDPSLGAVIQLNGHAFFATPAQGNWSREGQVWKYKTKSSVQSEIITLKLDLGSQTWDFSGKKLLLSGHFQAADSHAMVRLDVNGRYTFRFDVELDVKAKWELTETPADSQRLEVTKYSGSLGWQGREDGVLLEGKLPATLDGFGDFSVVINGSQRDFPLLSLADYQRAFQQGKELVVKTDGTHLVIDFGKKKWSAKFAKDQFARILAPRWGKARLGIKVGGASWYSREHTVARFSTKLAYKG